MKRLFVSAILFCIVLPFTAQARDIVLDDNIAVSGNLNIVGNSQDPQGLWDTVKPLDAPYNNSIKIGSGTYSATNNLTIAGAHADTLATGNSVTINGGSFVVPTGNKIVISGGKVVGAGRTAHYNTVTLSGSPIFSGDTYVLGGTEAIEAYTMELFSGNRLRIMDYSGSALWLVGNFQYYDFVLPATLGDSGVLLETNWLMLNYGLLGQTIPPTVTTVNVMPGGPPLKIGDKITLIKANGGPIEGTITNHNSVIQGRKGVALLYDFLLTKDTDSLFVTVLGGPTLNPQTAALPEGRIAALAALTNGGTLVASNAIDAATSATTIASTGSGSSIAAFATTGYQNERLDTGSHVDLDSFTLIAGLALRNELPSGTLTLGAFFEGGYGEYDSHNSFRGAASVKGGGDTDHYGGGLLLKYEMPCGFYADASLRMGRVNLDFTSDDLLDHTGRSVSYDVDSMYYGAHVGLGYMWQMSETLDLDLSAKYLWTHMDSADSRLSSSEAIRFETHNSHRLRAKAQLGWQVGEQFKPFIGAGYDHEFDGDVKASIIGYNINRPSLEGGTAFGELGVSITRMGGNTGLGLDLSVQGYTGQREGVGGNFRVKYEF